MGDEKDNDTFHHPYRLPTVLAPFDPVLVTKGEWVQEHPRGQLKTDTVLPLCCWLPSPYPR
jgi:hypothetical protein